MSKTQSNIKQSYWSKVARFLKRQAQQVREGGWPVIWNKVLELLKLLLMLPFTLPVVLIIRLISPFLVIRLGQLNSTRIGHFAGNTEVYLCERDAGINIPRRSFVDIWYHTPFVCNTQLKKMWDRTLHIIPYDITPLVNLNLLLPGGQMHNIPMPNRDRDVHGLMHSTPPHLSFTTDEEQVGKTGLKDLGISDGTPFVCLHSRDSAYLNNVHPDVNWQYHNYLDNSIENYMLTAEELVGRGYTVLRMGAIVEERLKTVCPKIIDYATEFRSDFMDIYLEAKCSFHLGSPSGLNAVPMVFRRPRAIVSFPALEYIYSWNPNELLIPKKLWLKEDSRFMTLREILESGVGRFLQTEEYTQYGIEVIENTPEEIKALAIEMDERLKGTWQTTAEDEDLQRRCWEIFKKHANPKLHGEYRARIGAHFLRNNLYCLQ